jgi:hypothetical protein
MTEFDKLKDDAEQYAQQHPEQVKEGEQAVERKLGGGNQDHGGDNQDSKDHGEQDHSSTTQEQ